MTMHISNTYAIVNSTTNIVENVIHWDKIQDYNVEDGYLLIYDDLAIAHINDTYNPETGKFINHIIVNRILLEKSNTSNTNTANTSG